jgi:hypothetical protein
MKSNMSSRIGPIGCECRWPAPGAFSRVRKALRNELAHAGSLCRHQRTPFRFLSLSRPARRKWLIRGLLPDAEGVVVIDEQGHESDLQRIHDAGLFEGCLANGPRHYRLRARYGERQVEIEDPYRFPPILSDLDPYLLGEGTHMHLYEKLGAHPMVSGYAQRRLTEFQNDYQ